MVSHADIHKAFEELGLSTAPNKALQAALQKMGHSAEDARAAMESALNDGHFCQNHIGEFMLPWKITGGGKTIFSGSEAGAVGVFDNYSEWRSRVDEGLDHPLCVSHLKQATGLEPSSWLIPVNLINSKGEIQRFIEKPLT